MVSFFAGQIPTAQQLDDTALVGTMVAHFRRLAAQSIPNASTVTPIQWDTEDYDILGGHSTVTNPSRYTVQREGWYMVAGAGGFASNATGTFRATVIRLNGSDQNASQVTVPPNASLGITVPFRTYGIYCVPGDYIEGCVFHNATGAINTDTGVAAGPNMMIWYTGLPN